MMDSEMAGSDRGFAVLEDVEVGTFACFVEWAYNGYYTPSEPVIEEISSDSGDENEGVEGEPTQTPDNESAKPVGDIDEHGPGFKASPQDECCPSSKDRKAKDRKKEFVLGHYQIDTSGITSHFPNSPRHTKTTLKEEFVQRKETIRKSSISIPPARGNRERNENYTDVFLCHARLHVFADLYDIESLKYLAVEELQATLKTFDLYTERTPDIVSLLRYVYAQKNASAEGEDIRAMLTQYVGYEMGTLMKDDDFRDLIIEDGGGGGGPAC